MLELPRGVVSSKKKYRSKHRFYKLRTTTKLPPGQRHQITYPHLSGTAEETAASEARLALPISDLRKTRFLS